MQQREEPDFHALAEFFQPFPFFGFIWCTHPFSHTRTQSFSFMGKKSFHFLSPSYHSFYLSCQHQPQKNEGFFTFGGGELGVALKVGQGAAVKAVRDARATHNLLPDTCNHLKERERESKREREGKIERREEPGRGKEKRIKKKRKGKSRPRCNYIRIS